MKQGNKPHICLREVSSGSEGVLSKALERLLVGVFDNSEKAIWLEQNELGGGVGG